MHVVIRHSSALLFLDQCARLVPSPAFREPARAFDGPVEAWARTKPELKAFHLDRLMRMGRDADILVPTFRQNKRVAGYAHHAAGGKLPKGSLLDAGGGVLVCSAPLVFVQLCRSLPLLRCITLGHFICGTYSKEPSVPSGVVDRHPLAAKAELEEFVRKAHHLRGSRNAAAALPWVLEGAASPKETELALPFYLPEHLGGYAFIPPEMNYGERLSKTAEKIEGSINAIIDVYWPEQKIGFEYTSYAEHGDPYKIGEDERRKLALQTMGIRLELVTNQQLMDDRQLMALAQLLADYGVPKAVSVGTGTNIPIETRSSPGCS